MNSSTNLRYNLQVLVLVSNLLLYIILLHYSSEGNSTLTNISASYSSCYFDFAQESCDQLMKYHVLVEISTNPGVFG